MTEHLIKNITLGHRVDRCDLLLFLELPVHYLNDGVFVTQQVLQLFNLVDLLGDRRAEFVELLDECFFVLVQALNVVFVPRDVPIQVLDLGCL